MFSSVATARRRSSSSAVSTASLSRAERHSSSAAICSASTPGSTVRIPPSSPVASGDGRRRLEAVLADDDEVAGLDPLDAVAVGVDERGLHVADGLDRAAVLLDDRHLGARALDELGDEAVHDLRALEDVGVLEQVGLVGEHLLDAQRPLLIPGAREAERLVPRRQLDRAGAGVAAERHGERLEHDALDVVLRLGLGQPERVDLHAVAEAQLARVLDAVALAADLLPQLRHRAHLRVLLDEADAGVDEERDAAEDLAHELLVDPRAHGVEDGDRVGQRVGDLLDGRRARLLEVVGADVDRVPLRDLGHGVGDHVGDEPHRGAGRERVRPAGEELLDDVVLGRALELGGVVALLLGGDDVERQQPGGRRVDRHRRVHRVQRDAVHERAHVAPVGDRDADLADLAAGELVIAVVAGLRREVERDREAGLPLREVVAVQLVGLRRRRVTRVGAHHPRPVALGQAMRRLIAHGPDRIPDSRPSRRPSWDGIHRRPARTVDEPRIEGSVDTLMPLPATVRLARLRLLARLNGYRPREQPWEVACRTRT